MKRILFMLLTGMMLAGCSHHTYTVGEGRNKNVKSVSNTSADSQSSGIVVATYPVTGGEASTAGVNAGRNTVINTGNPDVLRAYPNATVFRMSGDYANNVAVTLSPNGELVYFPAPTDITADSEPVELCEGWWLNNQGIGPNSVFTTYTFAEYASLPTVPSPEQLKNAIIPGAKVTEFMEIPMKISQANQNIEEVKNFLKKR